MPIRIAIVLALESLWVFWSSSSNKIVVLTWSKDPITRPKSNGMSLGFIRASAAKAPMGDIIAKTARKSQTIRFLYPALASKTLSAKAAGSLCKIKPVSKWLCWCPGWTTSCNKFKGVPSSNACKDNPNRTGMASRSPFLVWMWPCSTPRLSCSIMSWKKKPSSIARPGVDSPVVNASGIRCTAVMLSK